MWYLYWIHLLILMKNHQRESLFFKNKGINTNEKIYLINGDINNLSDIEKVFMMSIELNKKIESVIHFAGLSQCMNL